MIIALAQMNPTVGAIDENCKKIIDLIARARNHKADLIVFPEMAISGYPPEDLLLLPSFIEAIEEALNQIILATKGIAAIVGCVRKNLGRGEKGLFNSAAIIENQRLQGFQDKILLPDYDVFSERRYFEPGEKCIVWKIGCKKVAVTICEDIWQHPKAVEYSNYPRDPIEELKSFHPDLLVNLSASPFYMHRFEIRERVCKAAVKTLRCPLVICNQVGGNDSLIFDGYSLCVDASGSIFKCAQGFAEDLLIVDMDKTYHPITIRQEPLGDLFSALILGVRDYFHKLGWQKCCFGLSGGIDSAVVAVIAKKALGAENVLALALPSRFSSERSMIDAKQLVANLNIRLEVLSIEKPFEALLETLAPFFEEKSFDTTEENLQARIRGILLMAFSNKFGYLLLSSGNKSEMAMGYATLYGDMCGGLGVLSDVTKEQVYALAGFINKEAEVIPNSILTRPPSAELRFNQLDTDSLPEYPIVDRVLKAYVEEHLSPQQIAEKYQLTLTLVKELVRKIHRNEYKRMQAPPGLRVTKKAFTIGRRFPIVQRWNMEE